MRLLDQADDAVAGVLTTWMQPRRWYRGKARTVRAGRLHALTLDHSVVGERVARGELTIEEARVHPGRHVITRALGVVPGVEPDVSSLRVQAHDVFALCSDGISSQMSDEELGEAIEKRKDLATAAHGLIELANARGGDDNATVILVRLDG